MSQLNSRFGKAMTSDEYAEQWEVDSAAFEKAGIYRWICEQLGTHPTVLEVGCGSGRSTESLAKNQAVVSIEPNPAMANSALAYLRSKGVDANLAYETPSTQRSNVTIVIADILDVDSEWLQRHVRPNAIACWLIGAEPTRIAKHLSKELPDFTGIEMPTYRELVHRK